MMNNVKGEVIGPAHCPDRQEKQEGGFERGVFEDQEQRRQRADEEEGAGLGVEETGVLDIHGGLFDKSS